MRISRDWNFVISICFYIAKLCYLALYNLKTTLHVLLRKHSGTTGRDLDAGAGGNAFARFAAKARREAQRVGPRVAGAVAVAEGPSAAAGAPQACRLEESKAQIRRVPINGNSFRYQWLDWRSFCSG